MHHVVKLDRLYPDPANPTHTIAVGSDEWLRWLDTHDQFVFEDDHDHFTAHRETRRAGFFWYGYRRVAGKLHKVYLGKASDVTVARLVAANSRIAGEHLAETPAKTVNAGGLDAALQAATGFIGESGRVGIDILSLTNRLTPPAMPAGLVSRTRLTTQMNQPISLISAPSGFGKTTLLNEWRQQTLAAVAWVSVDGEDNTVYTLCAAITQALVRIDPLMGDTVSLLLQAQVLPPIQSVLIRLLDNIGRYLAANPGRRVTLIVDNYQRIGTPDIHTACQFFLDRLPERFQVIMASQTPFSFAVQRWRGRGILTELTRDDLRLTSEEGSAWLERNVAVPLTEAERRSLVTRTEGWAAGLNLLGLALKKRADVHGFVATFDGHHPYLQTYFIEEILDRVKPPWQNFLLQTSILRNLNGPLCDAVTGQERSADVLRALHQHNQFVTLVDEKRGWYQYHDLFAQALQRQLAQRQPAVAADLHRRAASWYQGQGLYGEALQHLIQAADWSAITRLIDQAIVDEIRQGSDHRVLTWLQRLPDEFLLHHMTVLVSYARLGLRSLPHGHITNMLQRLINTSLQTSEVSETSEVFGRTKAGTMGDRAFLTRLYEWARTNGAASIPRPTQPTAPEIERLWNLLDQIDEGTRALQQRWTPTGEKVFAKIMTTAKQQRLTFVVMVAGGIHASVLTRFGHLRRAETLARDALQWAIEHVDQLPPSASVPLLALSRISYARNELVQARRYLNHAAVIDPHPTSLSVVLINNGLLAYIESAEGNRLATEAALRVTQELEPYLSGVFGINDLKVHHARIYLRLGNLEAAESALRLAGPPPLAPHHSDDIALNSAWAELFLARQQYTEAEAVLKQSTATQIDLFIPITPLPHLLLARALWAQRLANRAVREMVSALRLGGPEGMLRPFLDCGPLLIPLLMALHTADQLDQDQQRFVAHLLDELQRSHPDAASPAEIASLILAIEISPREEETLRLLAQGLDNRTIAAHLVVSDSTVRTHLRHLYNKLGVNSRAQAVKRAQELQIV